MSREIRSQKRKAIDTEFRSKNGKTMNEEVREEHEELLRLSLSIGSIYQQPPQPPPPPPSKPPSMLRLKDEHVEPEHEELVRLTLSTGSTFQSPPQKPPPPPPPELPPHPSLLQLMPSSSSSSRSPEPPPESPPRPSFLQLMSSSSSRSPEPPPESPPLPSFLQLMSSFSSRSPEPPYSLVLPAMSSSYQQLHKNSISTLQPPPLPVPMTLTLPLHQSLSQPSSSSQYIEPPPGFHFSMPSSSRQLHQENVFTLKSPEPPVHYLSQTEMPHKPPQLAPPERPCYASSSSQPIFPEQQPQPPVDQAQPPELTPSPEGQAHRSGTRRSRNSKKPGWEPTIEPPYPWASSVRAKVLSMEELLSKNITVISGDVHCKECKRQFQIEYDLQSKFSEVVSFIAERKDDMHDRAPEIWSKPEELDCKFCDKSKCVQPLISSKKRETNWLFLFLGQMIGYCNLNHIK